MVQKYGGTSVDNQAASIATIVSEYAGHHRVAVVCSARSLSLKTGGTANESAGYLLLANFDR